jgi:CubicO group peptidase (beta-lactamase class C family)
MDRCRTLLFLVALSAAPIAPGCAQQRGGSGEQAVRDLVRTMNANDTASLRRFVEARFLSTGPNTLPVAERVERLHRLSWLYGDLSVHHVDPPTASEVSALVQSARTEEWMTITLYFDAAPEHRVWRVRLSPSQDPSAPAGRLSDAQIVQRLKAYVERLASRDVFSGAILVARAGKPLYRAAFGEANKDFGARNTPETKFNLGSMNKMFTAVAVLQLVEAGKLSLDDTLGRFLPVGAMRPEVLRKVRIKHLLTHTSGLGSYFTEEWDRQSRALYRSVDDWMALVRPESLQFEPGTRWSYSNTGMLVLGKVIEVASGRDYFDYVREHVYKPAGMTSSDAYELDRVNRNLAVGYEAEESPTGGRTYRNNIFAHVIRGGPAGGGYATVDDLTRFAQALEGGKLLDAEDVRLLTTAKPELNSPDYGFGFQIDEGGRVVGHSGGFMGIDSRLDIYVGEDYTVAALSNYGSGTELVMNMARKLILARRGAG